MDELIRRRCAGKKVAILGFGREGESTYHLLHRVLEGQLLTILDARDEVRDHPLLKGEPAIRIVTGPDYLSGLDSFDVIFRSPGIVIWPLMESDIHQPPGELTAGKFTSQTAFFLEKYHHQVIGVTGTKGKSTTASLISHILKTAGRDVILAGNIGTPLFNVIPLITPETMVVAELSSHQLELPGMAPHIGVFLNLFQEHLDAYPSYEAYQKAKLNIARFRREDDILVINGDDTLVAELTAPWASERCFYSFSLEHPPRRGCFRKEDSIWFCDGGEPFEAWHIHQDRFLKGEHNLKNIMAAIVVCTLCGVEREALEDGIGTFKGLEHRLEYVGPFHGIHFYNDSIATIPEACIEAVKSVPGVDTLVAGGFDRGIEYGLLGQFLAGSGVRNFILAGEAGRRIGDAIRQAGTGQKKFFFINRFDDFAPIAFRETLPGYVCMLSPAAASYDEFRNFEERGKRYRHIIQHYQP